MTEAARVFSCILGIPIESDFIDLVYCTYVKVTIAVKVQSTVLNL